MNKVDDIMISHMDDLLKKMDTFIGFYTSEGFWVDEEINPFNADCARRLAGIIPEVSIETTSDLFRALVCIDGLVLLRMERLATSTPDMGDPSRFSDSALWWDEHLDYANALLLLIESASLKCAASQEAIADAVSITDTCRVGFLNGVAVNRRLPGRSSPMRARGNLCAWIAGGMREPISPLDSIDDLGLWRVIKRSVLADAMDKFILVSKNADLVKRLSFIAKAKTAYKNNDYRVSFTLLWFVIESSIKSIFHKEPRTNSRKYSVSEAIKALRNSGAISDEVIDLVDALRVLRNQLMHEPGSTICHSHDCVRAAHAAIQLATDNANIDLTMKWQTGVQF